MKKRLLSLFLALLMVFSAMQVFAVGSTGEIDIRKVNLAPDCTFEEPFSEDIIGGYLEAQGSSTSWSDDGANGTNGSIKVKATPGGYCFVPLPWKETIGETFDCYFWVKSLSGDKKLTFKPHLNYYLNVTAGSTPPIDKGDIVTSEWQKFHYVYTNTGKVNNNGNPDVMKQLRMCAIFLDDGKETCEYLVDEIEIYARGNVEFTDYFTGRVNEDYYPEDTGFAEPKPIGESDFYDMNNHWAQNTVDALAKSSVVNGYGDDTFCPEKSVTRAEFVKLAMSVVRSDKVDYEGEYSDVYKDDWYADYIANARKLGIIDDSFTINGAFFPNRAINREEAASIIAKVSNMRTSSVKKYDKTFTDEKSISAWAKDGVYMASSFGIINGYPDGSFGPKKLITRAEASSMIFRCIELSGKIAYYVDGEKGNDRNDGSIDKPFKTIEGARKFIKPLLKDMKNHIIVYIAGGEYPIKEQIDFTTKDSGSNGYYVIYASQDKNNKATFTGGQKYYGFKLHDRKLNIYKTQVGKNRSIGEIFINKVRANLASTEYLSTTSINNKKVLYEASLAESFLINPTRNDADYSFVCDNRELLKISRPQDLRFVFNDQWTNPHMRISNIEETKDGRVKITSYREDWDVAYYNGVALASWPEYYENAIELLDSEGEYYYNKDSGYLYYKPRKYENPESMELIIPVVDDAFIVCGDEINDKVHNIRFDNLAFKYFTWPWENENFVHYNPDYTGFHTYKGDHKLKGHTSDAPLTIGDAAYIDVVGCEFGHLGGAGLRMVRAFQFCNIIGNHVYDTGGDGMIIGNMSHEGMYSYGEEMNFVSPRKFEYYKCYNTVKNNLIHDVVLTHRTGHALSIGHLKNSLITHNEIYNATYKAIHVGGGLNGYLWQGTGIRGLEISNNYVHETGLGRNYDAASIYIAGPSGGNEENYNQIKNNYLVNHRRAFGTLYFDSGSSYYEVSGNVSDLREVDGNVSEVFIWAMNVRKNNIHDNFSTTSNILFNQPDNIYKKSQVYPDANWSSEAQTVVDNAGLEPKYSKMLDDGIQRTKSLSADTADLNIGETMQFEVVAYKRTDNAKDVMADLPKDAYNYFSSDDSVATVDKNGVITAVGSGKCNVFAEYLEGEILRRQTIELFVDKKVVSIEKPVSSLNVIFESTAKITTLGLTDTNAMVELAPSIVEIEDPSIISIDEDGIIYGLKPGRTNVKLIYQNGESILEHECSIKVVKYNNGQETLEYAKKHARVLEEDDPFFDPQNWVGVGNAVAIDECGIDIVKGGPMWTNFEIKNELLSFDLKVTTPTTWPGFMFNCKDHNATTSNNGGDFYLLCISDPMVELQRFSTYTDRYQDVIFGYEALKPIEGIGYPNTKGGEVMGGELYATSNVTYSITAGAIDEPEGTRLIFILNGMPIYDYIDKNGIKDGGYWGVYNSSGTFRFTPFTDQRFGGYED